MDPLVVTARPELRDPIVVVAFAGWNDAASAATNAARFVVRRLGARKFATIEPDDFYSFTDTRPSVRVDVRGVRRVDWPTNEFFYARNPGGPHDVVVAAGVEPNLRWGAFTGLHEGLYRDLGAGMVVSLGALMADVPHTRPVRVTGTAADPDTATRLKLTTSRYEGPTGIVGVLHDRLRRGGITAVSLWANVPHYLTAAQNPPATLALLERLQGLIDLEFDFSELHTAGKRFRAEVDGAVGANPEISQYVRKLEEAASEMEAAGGEGAPLPSGQDLVLDVEEFLRGQRPKE